MSACGWHADARRAAALERHRPLRVARLPRVPRRVWSRPAPTSTGSTATFDRHDIRAIEPRPATDADGRAADEAIAALNDLGDAARPTRQLRLRHRQHRQPRRAGAVAVRRGRHHRGAPRRRCSPGSPTGSARCTPAAAARRAGRPQRGGRRARRPAAAPRRPRRPPDERVRGGPLRRALHRRVDVVGQPARATSRRS